MVASTSNSLKGTVNTITTDIPQAIHAALNADVENILSGGPLESREVEALFYIISASVEAYRSTNSPIIPHTMMALRDLLESNPEVKRLLLEAHQSGDYNEIRRRPEFHIIAVEKGAQDMKGIIRPTDLEPFVGIDIIDRRVKKELQSLRVEVEAFLKNPEAPTWNPPDWPTRDVQQFLTNLQLPCYANGHPSLLLHDLDACDGDEIKKLFGSVQRMAIRNTSGTGKTRLMLESLTKFWGFYLVAGPDVNGVGVRDLRDALEDIAGYHKWVSDLRPLSLGNRANQSNTNSSIASNLLKRVLAARIVVFELFLELAIKADGELLEKHKRFWLLFQLRDKLDPRVETKHPFVRIIDNCLRQASTEALDILINRFDRVCARLPPSHFIIGLDEAQQAVGLYRYSFTSFADGQVLRSILQKMVSVITRLPCKLVVSGTDFPLVELHDSLASGVSKPIGEVGLFHELGMFDTWPKLKPFLERYLPASFLNTLSGLHLQHRIRGYLLGRYRFSVTFLEWLLMNGMESPHKLFNRYIEQHTTCVPGDSGFPFTLDEPEPKLQLELSTSGFEWDRLQRDEPALEEVSLVVQSHITQGESPTFGPVTAQLVEYGIAQLRQGRNGHIVEPLTFLSLLKWLESEPNLKIFNNIQSQHASLCSRRNAHEEVAILFLLRVLRYPVPFSTIFTFYHRPQWADEQALIVGYLDETAVAVDVLGKTSQNQGLGVLHYADRIEDVIYWVENPTTTPAVLVSAVTFGPDLMIRTNGVLLMGRLKSYTEGNKDCLDDALTSLHVDNWFKQSRSDLRARLINAIEQHHVLRFVGGYPLPSDLALRDPSLGHILSALGPNAVVATLNLDIFRAQFITEDQAKDVFGPMEHVLSRKRKRQMEENNKL